MLIRPSDVFPTHFIAVHQSAIRALAWIRVPPTDGSGVSNPSEDPTVIASGGYDGVECLTDIREPHGNVVNRTRGTFHFATTPSLSEQNPIVRRHQQCDLFCVYDGSDHDRPRQHCQVVFRLTEHARAWPYSDGT